MLAKCILYQSADAHTNVFTDRLEDLLTKVDLSETMLPRHVSNSPRMTTVYPIRMNYIRSVSCVRTGSPLGTVSARAQHDAICSRMWSMEAHVLVS